MLDSTAAILIGTAGGVAFVHAAVGVDHYLPFVVLARARNWSLRRTLGITAACGVGHVLSSILIGAIGLGLGAAAESLEFLEGVRGSVAAWGLIAFGLVYAAWSAVRAYRGKQHHHAHVHADGTLHDHNHGHAGEHLHVHEERKRARVATTWTLFILFAFGPCEALIPLFIAPASVGAWGLVWVVAAVFGLITIATMLVFVTVGVVGLKQIRFQKLEPHAGTLAGLAIALSGLAIQVLGI